MKCLLTKNENKKISTAISEVKVRDLQDGEVLIHTEYSSLNYKDALGVTGRGPIFKNFPIIGGIDAAGTVVDSRASQVKKGEFVLVTGGGLGETRDGGYAEYIIDNVKNIVLRPTHLSAREAMIYGTAGFTAALCVERMIQNGQIPEMGPLLVTGATGGVGQFAISFFSKLGYEVHALTGKRELAGRLTEIGAKKVIFTSQLELGERPLESIRYGGAIDNIGGATLGRILATTNLWGNVCSVGMADSAELQTTVFPLILRGVSLLGISSNNTPRNIRLKIWERLASDLKPDHLDNFVSAVITLDDVVAKSEHMLSRQTHGRILIHFE